MPIEFMYLIMVFAIAIIGFSVLKRPLYECMLAAFLVLVLVTGNIGSIGQYIWDALTEPTLYVIIVFVISASLLSKTTVIDDCIAMIISFFGRLPGGAGFVAIIVGVTCISVLKKAAKAYQDYKTSGVVPEELI